MLETRIISRIVVAASCVLFLLSGLAILPYPGIQNDEALFAAPLYAPKSYLADITVSHVTIPIMQMSYLGCLKAWVYKPIFSVWRPSVYSVRVPVLLMGSLTIFLSWLFLGRTAGDRAAIVGTLLLATDTTLLLTTCFDWGPVALQHLLTVGGVLALVCFYQSGRPIFLGLGFFLFGIALWDKALFSWMLGGLTVATLAVFPSELFKQANWRRILIAALCFALGAFPLIWSNLQRSASTFGKENVALSSRHLGRKFEALIQTVDGSALFDYLVGPAGAPRVRSPRTSIERFSVSLGRITAGFHRNFANVALVLAAVLIPFLWHTTARKQLVFTLSLCGVAWALMAATARAGASAHQTILLWPFPIFFVAIAFAQASHNRWIRKEVFALIIALLVGSNLLVTNRYLSGFITNGGNWVWDDAIFGLADYLKGSVSSNIYTVDWGPSNPLRLLDQGTLKLFEESFTLYKSQLDDTDRSSLGAMISDPSHILVGHTPGFEAFPGINGRLAVFATRAGYEKLQIKTICDREGRPVFDIFHYRRVKETERLPFPDPGHNWGTLVECTHNRGTKPFYAF